MADRTFDYENIASIYNQMRNITGTSGDADSIAGILGNIDKDYRAVVGVEDGALFGALGDQLLLDWDNSSSDFPNFINNFQNWSTLIAQSSDKYEEFERKVSAVRTANPLGVSAVGMTQNYIDTSYYREYKNSNYDQYVTDLANVKQLQAITGAEYTFTDSVSMLKKHQIITGGETVLLAVGTAIWGASLYGVGSGGTTPPSGTGTETPAGTGTGTPPPTSGTGASGANGSNVIEFPTSNPGSTPVANPGGSTVTNPGGNVIEFPTSSPGSTPVANPGGSTVTNPGGNVIEFPTSNPGSTPIANPGATTITNPGGNVIEFPTANPGSTPIANPSAAAVTNSGGNIIEFPTSGNVSTGATSSTGNVIQFPGAAGAQGAENIIGIANAA